MGANELNHIVNETDATQKSPDDPEFWEHYAASMIDPANPPGGAIQVPTPGKVKVKK